MILMVRIKPPSFEKGGIEKEYTLTWIFCRSHACSYCTLFFVLASIKITSHFENIDWEYGSHFGVKIVPIICKSDGNCFNFSFSTCKITGAKYPDFLKLLIWVCFVVVTIVYHISLTYSKSSYRVWFFPFCFLLR